MIYPIPQATILASIARQMRMDSGRPTTVRIIRR
jgi:hypothetical protein